MTRSSTWVEMQQRIKSSDDTHAVQIVLEGPDQTRWGTWPIDTQNLGIVIDEAVKALGEDSPTGRHQARLLALDKGGSQVSMQPVLIVGRSGAASAAATDAIAMQRAVATMAANAESMLNLSRSIQERQEKAIDELLDDRTVLIQKFNEILATNIETELAIKAHAERSERMDQLLAVVVASGGPVVLPLVEKVVAFLGVKLDRALVEATKDKPAELPPTTDPPRASEPAETPPAATSPADPRANPPGPAAACTAKPAGGTMPSDASAEREPVDRSPGAGPVPRAAKPRAYGSGGGSGSSRPEHRSDRPEPADSGRGKRKR